MVKGASSLFTMNPSAGILTHIAPVFRVADIPRSLNFYRDQLGFAVEFVHDGFYAGVCREGCHIHFKCAPPTPRDQAAFERDGHIDAFMGVQNAEVLADGFASAGVAFVVPLRHMPYGTEFYVRDPDNYVLGFVQATSN
jgi:catechol 2,3-dioxygenase-like lactoylglutathione lyase family enzyme